MIIEKKYGLSDTQVQERIQAGKKNITQSNITKTRGQIIQENVCTLFNLLNILIALALAMVGAWTNMVFILIIFANMIVGIWQELKAKKLVENLSLLSKPEVVLIRNQKSKVYGIDEIVLDDIMLLDSGKQICCDSIVVDGEVEVNESLLTGESDAITKRVGDHLLSGSSIICGKCLAKVEHVGDDNYAAKLTKEAKKLRKINSELMQSMKKVTKLTTYLIIPLGVILFVQAFYVRQDMMLVSIVSSSAALLGMLPKGLVLLISISLAGGVIKLAKQEVLIQDLYSLESLSHVNVLCIDKTGTLTEGNMSVKEACFFEEGKSYKEKLPMIMGSFLKHCHDTNATHQALKDFYPQNDQYQVISKVPFSSQRKWSSISFMNLGTIVIGAPERLLTKKMPSNLQKEMENGKRVVIVGITQEIVEKDSAINNIIPVAAIIITDHVRKSAVETLDYFDQQGVDVKIISGDNPVTVSAVAKEAGLRKYPAFIDMDTVDEQADYIDLTRKYSIFGRTTPDQKKRLVQALKQDGQCVAMMGDGVNDLLALQEADCSIAVAAGSDAARQISQLVLLNSDFGSLPDVLGEGRRVVHNVTRAAGVFFIKTIYSILVTIFCVILNVPFPFIPIQITFLDLVIEAYPAFLTAFEPNDKKVIEKFLPTAMRKSFPHALAIVCTVLLVWLLTHMNMVTVEQGSTVSYLLVGVLSLRAVIETNQPFTMLRKFVCITMVIGYAVAIPLFHSILQIELLTLKSMVLLVILVCVGLAIELLFSLLSKKNEVKIVISD